MSWVAQYLQLVFAIAMSINFTTQCTLPETLRLKPAWESAITKARQQSGLYLSFSESSVEIVDYIQTSTRQVSQIECVQDMGENMFIMKINSIKQDEKDVPLGNEIYKCYKFLIRSKNVAQMEMSAPSAVNGPSLCSENSLFLYEYPLVQTQTDDEYTECPFQGGFKFYIKEWLQVSLCRDATVSPNLESDCVKGDGINIQFQSSTCRGALGMQLNQKLNCLGSWNHGQYQFTVVSDDDEFFPKLWILRMPVEQGNEFKGMLIDKIMTDTRAVEDFEVSINPDNDGYYILYFTRIQYPSLCENVMNSCTDVDCSMPEGYLCMKKCTEKCNAMRMADEGPALDGDWSPISENYRVTVDPQMFYIDGELSMFWLNFTALSQVTKFNRYPVYSLFSNGCKPRLACTEMQQLAENVLQYKLSQTSPWPPISTPSATLLCDDKKFVDDVSPIGDTYRSKYNKYLTRVQSGDVQDIQYQDSGFEFTKYLIKATTTGDNTVVGVLDFPDYGEMNYNDCLNDDDSIETISLTSALSNSGLEKLVIVQNAYSLSIQCWLFFMNDFLQITNVYTILHNYCDQSILPRKDEVTNLEGKYEYKFEVLKSGDLDMDGVCAPWRPTTTTPTTSTSTTTTKTTTTSTTTTTTTTDPPKELITQKIPPQEPNTNRYDVNWLGVSDDGYMVAPSHVVILSGVFVLFTLV